MLKSQNSSVGIAMSYGLDVCGSIPGKGKIFLLSTVSRPALGPNQLIQWVLGGGGFPSGEAAGMWSWPLTSI
jgi:hypothetical protein